MFSNNPIILRTCGLTSSPFLSLLSRICLWFSNLSVRACSWNILMFRNDLKSRLLFKESFYEVRRHSGQHNALDIPIGTLPSVKDSLSDLLIGSVGHFLIKGVFLLLLHQYNVQIFANQESLAPSTSPCRELSVKRIGCCLSYLQMWFYNWKNLKWKTVNNSISWNSKAFMHSLNLLSILSTHF